MVTYRHCEISPPAFPGVEMRVLPQCFRNALLEMRPTGAVSSQSRLPGFFQSFITGFLGCSFTLRNAYLPTGVSLSIGMFFH